ncbi:MAG: hypothetical protein NT129_05915 [Candidatus Aenigmarchaeota archaeon]|nr:hypothetical protein [Candidatus Aenigmarchaeota archaeon]
MKEIQPDINQIKITEYRDWQHHKVKKLVSLSEEGKIDFIQLPIYLVRERDVLGRNTENYIIYDGNSRFFLASNGRIPNLIMHLLETDADLDDVRRRNNEIYWPGHNLEVVERYLTVKTELLCGDCCVRS